MKNHCLKVVTALLLALALLCAGCADGEGKATGSTAENTAANPVGKPVVLDFGKGQCVQCIKQTAVIDEIKPQCEDKVDFQFVHVIDEASLAGRYQVFMIPTLVFLDAAGEEVYRKVGTMDADELRGKIESLGWAKF